MIFLILAVLAFSADESADLTRARQHLDSIRQQAAAGLLPTAAIADAEAAVEDISDEALLDQTLYGRIQIEDLTEAQADTMVSAAGRRVERVRKQLEPVQKMVEEGIAPQSRSADLEAQLAARLQALEQARARAALLMQIVDMAHAEAAIIPDQIAPAWRAKEHVLGDHLLESSDIREITLAFEKQFREPFPVSARGETAVHRAMGFDHTGRIDVALTPDSSEGVWLRKYLEGKSIPYYAFRIAIPGKATAPHIHIGPPSTRLPATD